MNRHHDVQMDGSDSCNDYVPGTVNLDFISVSGAANSLVNPNLRQPMTTETTGSFEHELRENLGVHAVYVFRQQTGNYDSAGWNVARPYGAPRHSRHVRTPAPTASWAPRMMLACHLL